ncbi:protein-L-isoaspartate(D-aspartate) O-methyltransferase [Oceanobacter sp. 2_MG-2023]|nr:MULTISPECIES: protein-L-isoaspartate(D-aspartate) O-methyltransferase [unclassified Oceanobacter]MDP2608256.1 protein-L-isoaspartate(D-aspartate) O-methyltransferase [Oceanobacter sp. 1_MG-2023]MDP2612141.1 protein-L-isoaspartate(D-aspartate) O-methyltransferase [Oceanobacter sp. 2_MG-2023]
MDTQQLSGIGMTSQRTRNRLVQRLREAGVSNEQVLSVIASTPRHVFIDEALAHRAYEDTALPIGYGQTISQPYTVARMTEILLGNQQRLGRVLEVGTGCGYQAAVLSPLVDHLFSVERIEPLFSRARNRLSELEYRNIHCSLSDGSWGLPEKGPFDGIIVAAAPEQVPSALQEQLVDGGRMVIPVGGEQQKLTLITRDGDTFVTEILEDVLFVPFLSGIQR